MEAGAYRPHQDASAYPGAQMSEERAERLRNLDVEIDEITVDDIVWSVSRNGSSIFFLLMRMVAETSGEDVARQLARRFGEIVGRTNYRKMRRRFGVTTLGPERLARYEDTVHLLGGSDMAYCFSAYDEDTCTIRRTRCAFQTGAPPGVGHYCPFVNDGFAVAYQACDPGLIEITYDKSLSRGDPYCEHVFRYRRPPPREEEGASAAAGDRAYDYKRTDG
jgi:hypothetical protein